MLPAAFRFLVPALLLLAPVAAPAAGTIQRAAPFRPGTATTPSILPVRKFGSVEYVSVTDVAGRLGLKAAWTQRGRRIVLTGPAVRAELENDTRDVTINGLRVFLGDPVLDAAAQLYVSRIDFERCLTPLLRPGFGVATVGAPRLIVLDPGHGGKDNGTSAYEKTYALDVARRARKLLEAAGQRVVLTRDSDKFLELAERSEIANAQRADLFVSIHFNAVPRDSRTSGVEVFTFAPKSQHAAEWWSVLKKDDPHLETTDMPVNRFDHWNTVLAQSIQRHFVVDLKAFDRGRKLAHWGVLRQLNCPGVLVECGFLTSDADAKKIATPAYRQKLAEAIAAGIRDYSAVAGATRATGSAASSKSSRAPKTRRTTPRPAHDVN